jgi:hypothetical protein
MLYALILTCTGQCVGQTSTKTYEPAKTFKTLAACQKAADKANAHSLPFLTADGADINRSDVDIHAHCVALK